MTVAEIKALPRMEDGRFDLSGVNQNCYKAALEVYPAYAEFETKENKKEGYPDIMAQMRLWDAQANQEFNMEKAAGYVAMLYGTIECMSPEIYEYYKELVDMFRKMVKRVLAEYYSEEKECFAEGADEQAVETFCATVCRACDAYLLLAEKYQMCFR